MVETEGFDLDEGLTWLWSGDRLLFELQDFGAACFVDDYRFHSF